MFRDIKFSNLIPWVLVSIFYAYQYTLRIIPNIVMNDVMERFNINSTMFGQFSGIYYIGYCLAHIPIAVILDRYSIRKTIAIFIALTLLGTLPLCVSNNWILLIIGRFFVGVGSSCAIVGVIKIIEVLFDVKFFGMMFSLSLTLGFCGAMFGLAPLVVLIDQYGYNQAIFVLLILGVILCIVTYIFLPDRDQSNVETKQYISVSDLKSILSNKRILLVSIFAGFMNGPFEGFADAWGSEFLIALYQFDHYSAHHMIFIIYIGMCFIVIPNYLANKYSKYLEVAILTGLCMTIVFILLLARYLINPYIMRIGFFLIGISYVYQVLLIHYISLNVKKNLITLTDSTINMILMSFGYVFHSVIGTTIDIYKSTYGSSAIACGISTIPILMLLGVVGIYVSFKNEINFFKLTNHK